MEYTEKIAVNGVINENKITGLFKNSDIEIHFNVKSDGIKTCNEYSAVFFTGNYDKQDLHNWIGNEHLRVTDSETELLNEIKFFLGIPEPVEIERKFLIKYPTEKTINSIKECSSVEISQCYVSDENGKFRVRKRGKNGEYIYIKTEKTKISEIRRIESERRITQSEYESAIKGKKVLSKRRYMFLYNNKYFELDIFPFWQDKALLEIELKDENEQFDLPDFLNITKEVTYDPKYKNSHIAKLYATPAD